MEQLREARIRPAEVCKVSSVAAILLEVMDKEWPLWFVVAGFLGVGLFGLFVCMKRPIAVVLFLAWAVYGAIRQLAELNDPYVGPAIRSEAGLP
jgi:uncharacterized RDD family membrane protein YckC